MEISQAVQLLNWCEKMLELLGVWPLNPNDTRFTLTTGYLIIHLSLVYIDLIKFLNNFDHVVANLTQNLTFTVIVLKVILLRWKSERLGIVIKAVKEDFHVANYSNPKEINVFLASYKKARTIVGILIPLVFFTATSMYVVPLIDLLENRNKNGTVELNLPYYTHMFYDVTNVRAYTLTYLAQLPFVFISATGYTGSDYLLVTLVLHICGQFSVLVERIDNLNTDHRECGAAIKHLVKMHIRLISMTMTLGEAYSLVLLAQVLKSMLLICVLSYDFLVACLRHTYETEIEGLFRFLRKARYKLNVMLCACVKRVTRACSLSQSMKEGQVPISTDFFYFLSYIANTVLMLHAYCYVGENLVEASTRVHRAFSECGWEKMPVRHAKSIIICVARSQQPLGLSAGKFYTLSLRSFTGVSFCHLHSRMMRTSMAYFSVLRSLL